MKKFRWIFGCIFVLSGLGSYASSPATGIFAILLGLFIIPPVTKFVGEKVPFEKRGKYITAGILLLLYTFSASAPKTITPSKAEVKSLKTQFKATATVQPTNTIFYTPTTVPTIIVATLTSVPPTPVPTVFIPSNTPYIPPPTSVPAQQVNVVNTYVQPTNAPAVQNSGGGWGCDCSKTCPQMSSCAEAQYQLNTCGCSARDADHDGVACDVDCQ